MNKKNNHLLSEKSPYLLQHAYNPVEWYPWGEEAFAKAKEEDKPIFLSIGYSTCHWCHVMEKESFEDIEVAKIMNETFVSIKVDREERPDIDKVYMDFCQLMTGSGGWPLSIIMTPEKKPFFAATYIPKHNKYGRAGMLEMSAKIKELWSNNREEIMSSSENIANHFLETKTDVLGSIPDEKLFDLAFENLAKIFDFANGGFGSSPKFPTTHRLQFLLRYWKRTKNEFALQMVEKTIKAMRAGGIWDHVGSGFHRYSTDESWGIPHFEKMLYDQALIALCCIETFQATGSDFYRNTAEEIFSHVLDRLTSEDGGFYSAEDADSEGVEGKFYFWSREEIKNIFTENESEIIIDFFNIANSPSGENILFVNKEIEEAADKYGLEKEKFNEFITKAKQKMFALREKRIHPFRDEKILTDWNGLMISAFAMGARVFNNQQYKKTAEKAAYFILNNLVSKKGRLLHRFMDSDASVNANLDDYSFFVMGLLDLYETTFDVYFLKQAVCLSKYMIDNFWDNKSGGFYFTQPDSELSEFKKKDIYDGAVPSGNSIALLNLIKLNKITANPLYEKKVLEIIKAFSNIIDKSPEIYTQFISSFDFFAGPSFEIVITGYLDSAETKNIIKALNAKFLPNKVVIFKEAGKDASEITSIAEYIKDMKMVDNMTTVYVCSGYACKAPVNDIGSFNKLLD